MATPRGAGVSASGFRRRLAANFKTAHRNDARTRRRGRLRLHRPDASLLCYSSIDRSKNRVWTGTGESARPIRIDRRGHQIEDAASRERMNAGLIRIFCITVAMAITITACAKGVTVFAAASLSDALACVGTNFQTQSGIRVEFNFAASSTLARQIEEGAPADIFFSADEIQMDRLARENLIDVMTRKNILGNALVVVVPSESTVQLKSPEALTNPRIRLIALADPKAVPAGVYAKAWLERIGLWQKISPKVVSTENVRAALAAVASGNVDAGVVYKTDAAVSQRVKIAYEVPHADSSDIRYPVTLVRGSKNSAAAKQFLDYLSSEQAGQVFTRFGFLLRK